MDKFNRDFMVSKRLGLDYARLFNNENGGYDLNTLKAALEKLQKDKENGVEYTSNMTTSKKLRDFLAKRLSQSKKADEGEEQEESADVEEEEGDSERLPSIRDNLINSQDAEEVELVQALMDYMYEQSEKEAKEAGEEFEDPFGIPDEHTHLLNRIYYEDKGRVMFDKWDSEDLELRA